MLHRRICYGLTLLSALLFQIFYTGYLGTYLLALVLIFPLFALLISLPIMLLARLTVAAEQPVCVRGEEGMFVLCLTSGARLPLARLTLHLRFENLLTGDVLRMRRQFRGASDGAVRREDITAHHCGVLRCTASRLWVCDLLGLFALPLRAPAPATLLVMPHTVEVEPPPVLSGGHQDGVTLRPRPGGGPGEDYDLRPYRPGDPLRSVHWKLSSKLDDLVVRETLEPQSTAIVLTFDHFGDADGLDGVLDRVYTLSQRLLTKQRPHHIQWVDPVTGAVQGGLVADQRALYARLNQALSTPAPQSGRSILDTPIQVAGEHGRAHHLHINPEEGGVL